MQPIHACNRRLLHLFLASNIRSQDHVIDVPHHKRSPLYGHLTGTVPQTGNLCPSCMDGQRLSERVYAYAVLKKKKKN